MGKGVEGKQQLKWTQGWCPQETEEQLRALSCPHTSSDLENEAPETPLAGSGLTLDEQGKPGVIGLGPAALN